MKEHTKFRCIVVVMLVAAICTANLIEFSAKRIAYMLLGKRLCSHSLRCNGCGRNLPPCNHLGQDPYNHTGSNEKSQQDSLIPTVR